MRSLVDAFGATSAFDAVTKCTRNVAYSAGVVRRLASRGRLP
jgi:hypothetical protein